MPARRKKSTSKKSPVKKRSKKGQAKKSQTQNQRPELNNQLTQDLATLPQGTILKDVELANYIRTLPGPDRYFHLSIRPLKSEDLSSIDQPLIMGFNCSGRPSGFYFGVSDSWMRFLIDYRSTANWNFCCYLYEIEIDESKFLKLDSLKKVKEFDQKTSDYWLGYENYDVCSNWGNLNPARKVSFHKLFQKYRKGNKSLGDIYLDEKIIYKNEQELQKERKSLGLKPLLKPQVENERRKRWDLVAEKYDGLLLTHFYDSYEKYWYESFTVAQGCIWNMKSLKRITPIAHVIGRPGQNFTFMVDRSF